MNSNNELVSLEKLSFDELVAYINQMIAKDFAKLVYLLYAVDVSEKKLKQILAEHPNEDAGKLIAIMILERQEQKRKSREQFKQPEQDIPDEDKW
jgi:predicted nucleotidyltransferase component of viral defense system